MASGAIQAVACSGTSRPIGGANRSSAVRCPDYGRTRTKRIQSVARFALTSAGRVTAHSVDAIAAPAFVVGGTGRTQGQPGAADPRLAVVARSAIYIQQAVS